MRLAWVPGAQLVEAGGGVGEQVPDDDQDGAGDGDQGPELAAAPGDPPVPLAEEGGGPGRRGGPHVGNGQYAPFIAGLAVRMVHSPGKIHRAIGREFEGAEE